MIGLLLLITVSVLLFSMMQQETKVTATQVIKNVREFDLGERITLYETANLLTTEEIKALEKYALVEFFQSDFPIQYQSKAEDQNNLIKGQRDLLAEQGDTPQQTGNLTELAIQSEQEQQVSQITGVKTSELTASRTATTLIENSAEGNVYIRGSIVKVVGKIEMERATPYFYNVLITCCGMDSFRAMSAVETDAFGNFVLKFATTTQFPLGDWTVTISTIGDDGKIIKHFYNFKLLAPPE
jgi:hypothetical protein